VWRRLPVARVRALALDFDGVISDSAREAFVVALRTHCTLEPGSLLSPLAARVTPENLDAEPLYSRFIEIMALGNRAEDYEVSLRALEVREPIPDQASYDTFKAGLDADGLRRFHKAFYRVRAQWATADPAGWLSAMAPYPRFVEVLRRRGGELNLAIATSKDRRSARELLVHYGVADLFPEHRVLDKETGVSKRSHLELLRDEFGTRFEDMTFVDDKVNHLVDVAPLGVRCVLAAWGYNGEREHVLARARGFVVCPLEAAERVLFGDG
jgi:phosphoglycolate phosphatase-like HAD superfamily hydrolase